MKALPAIIIVSLAANAALIALLLNAPAPSNPAGTVGATAKTATATAAGGASGATKTAAVVDAIGTKTWGDLTPGDYPALIERLRAAGFPPAVVRAIVAAQINEGYSARRKALMASRSDAPFWERNDPLDPKAQAALRELGREQSKQLKELFGTNLAEEDPFYAAYQRREFGDLPREKIDQLTQVRRDYDELRQEIYGASRGGAMLPEDRAKLALLDKEQREDFAKVLTPQELEAYELRSSSTANQMRYSLDAFGPNEAEFRKIYELQKPFDEKFSMNFGPLSEDQMRQRSEAQKQLTEQIKAALGPERAADYERATNYQFQQINRIVGRLELPKETALQVWNVQKDIEQRAAAVRSNSGLSAAARAEQLSALAQEATTKVTGAMGQRGLQVYQQYGGNWIQSLQGGRSNPMGIPTGSSGGGMMIMGP